MCQALSYSHTHTCHWFLPHLQIPFLADPDWGPTVDRVQKVCVYDVCVYAHVTCVCARAREHVCV